MSSVVGSQAGNGHTRAAGAAPLAVGGAAAGALAVLVWALGYLGSLPFEAAPGAHPEQGANLYLPLAIVWAVAAAAALVSSALSPRRPWAAAVLALAALVTGFAAPLLLTPDSDGSLPIVVGLLAWLVPSAALLVGLVAAAPRVGRGSKP